MKIFIQIKENITFQFEIFTPMLHFPKKIFLIFTLFVLLSCNSSKNNNRITLAHSIKDPDKLELFKDLISKFENDSNCTVELILFDKDNFKSTKNLFTSKSPADLIIINNEFATDLANLGYISEIKSQNNIIGSYVDGLIDNNKNDPVRFSVPFQIEQYVLFYNKQLFKKAGLNPGNIRTLADLQTYADRINTTTDSYKFGAVIIDPDKSYKAFLPFAFSMSANIADSKGNLVLYSSQLSSALNYYLQISREGIKETNRHIQSLFTSGRFGMIISNSNLIEKIKKENAKLDYGIIPFPGTSYYSIDAFVINSKSTQKDISAKLAKYMCQSDIQAKLFNNETNYSLPVNKTAFTKFSLSNPLKKVIADQYHRSKSLPYLNMEDNNLIKLDNYITNFLLGSFEQPEVSDQ